MSMTPEEAADRIAIRELIDAYAHCADRRDAERQMPLFTPDTHFVVYMDARSSEPSHGAEQPGGAHAGLRRSEPLRRDDAFQRTEHSHDLRRHGHRRELLPGRPRVRRGRRTHDHDRLDPI